MTLLNPWALFGLIPLYFIYKRQSQSAEYVKQKRLLYLSLLFMILALSRPALTQHSSDQKIDAQDYIVALDASYSMQADDLHPSRYIMAKRAIQKLLKLHPKDRFTLFAFTSNALLIAPPTTDSALAMQALNALNPEYILTKSTSLLQLFKSVAKISKEKKKLIIFSDGGEEHDLVKLTNILKENHITPYFVATATTKGAALKKDGKYLKDIHAALVVSRINPMLQDLAKATHGGYYQLTSLTVINQLASDIEDKTEAKELTFKVKSYQELFVIPLAIALFLYFIAVTKIHQIYLLLPLLLLPYKADASLFDFYHLKEANKNFQHKHYHQAALEFTQLSPSVKSYYNIASAYYKAGEYKNALRYFTRIKTSDRSIKQAIFYDIANCAVQLKKYDEAKEYYIKALALGYDSDALYNLNLLRKQRRKTSNNIMQKKSSKEKTRKQKSSKKDKANKDRGSSNSNRQSIQSSNGQGKSKKKEKSSLLVKQKNRANKYKMAYKAYEIINKGYSNEKEPW